MLVIGSHSRENAHRRLFLLQQPLGFLFIRCAVGENSQESCVHFHLLKNHKELSEWSSFITWQFSRGPELLTILLCLLPGATCEIHAYYVSTDPPDSVRDQRSSWVMFVSLKASFVVNTFAKLCKLSKIAVHIKPIKITL